MSLDFTYTTLASLLETLSNRGFLFSTLHNFAASSPSEARMIILRHDVEDDYNKALTFARTEHRMGIMGSYYFRLFPVADNDRIISQIAALGHEVGYHYDDLSVCKGNHEAALKRFQKNLAHLRQFAPVTTITMEGAPLSKYDNRDLWKQPLTPQLLESLNLESSNPQQINPSTNQPANKITSQQANISTNPLSTVHYSLFSIIAEPYFDLDFNQFFYLTDTGRCWDGWNVSVRDKVSQQEEWVKQGLVFHSTEQIIRAANEGRLPDKIMMTFHPQRWTDNHVFWLKELVLQRLKNVVKRGLVRF
ncbi:MAG: hypothetical protein PF484_00455 [Bacteroidales bacterium]|jgi:hypothetical protein|nr:hypothetical protein [Bacteroidales bacterium]